MSDRLTVNQMRSRVRSKIAVIKDLRSEIKSLREQIKREAQINRIVKEDARLARRAKLEQKAALRAQRVAERIAKAEARLEAMRLKAAAPKQVRKSQRKASDAVVYSAEKIAEMNGSV